MKKKDASFWSDIKTLDERLKKDPDSFCFARLSEIYLKVGLVADALHTARAGVSRHPGYLAGQRALGMACNSSGLFDESRSILEKVTAAIPEDVDAQKVLATLYVASGERDAAIRAYSTVLEFRPEDRVCLSELETLRQATDSYMSTPAASVLSDLTAVVDDESDDEGIIELSESDVYEEPADEETSEIPAPVSGVVSNDHHDPLSTLTLAELYEKQGFESKALDIYRTILADDPTNPQLLAKVAALEGIEPVASNEPEEDLQADFEEESDFSVPEPFETQPVIEDTEVQEPVSECVAEDFIPEITPPEPVESVSDFSADAFKPVESSIETSEAVSGFAEDVFAQELPVEEAFEIPAPAVESVVEPVESSIETSEAVSGFAEDAFAQELPVEETFEIPAPAVESVVEPVVEAVSNTFDSEFALSDLQEQSMSTVEPTAFAPLANKAADNVVDTLDSWLENIRRIKACR